MSLLPADLSAKLVDLSRLLRQSGESTAQVNRLREQLATSGPNALVAQRLEILCERAIKLSWEEQHLLSSCVRNLEALLRSVSTSTSKRSIGGLLAADSQRAGSPNGTRSGSLQNGANGTAGSASGAGTSSMPSSAGGNGPKAKKARTSEADPKLPAAVSSSHYPDVELPEASGAEAEEPLCGAVPPPSGAVHAVGARVIARVSGPKVLPQQWVLTLVTRYMPAKSKYILRADDGTESGRVHTITSKFVHPLPAALPALSVCSARNTFAEGTAVFALYPSTSRFCRATVVQAPDEAAGRGHYVLAFDAIDLEQGQPALTEAVPAAYVTHLPAGLNEAT